ncbi:splicing factor, CC1-like protein [Actinidia rufa]|uniref:Splicing factor, CC1-like protein n=1 Tax=Actinidia rufa TaxID=165716 RepID=A0A7J0F786_9ERIC|nr:splicing factor, CC1-like protein [Actinidia rufa]
MPIVYEITNISFSYASGNKAVSGVRPFRAVRFKDCSMDFDEYDYLEKTVENLEPQKLKESLDGGEETLKSGEKESIRSSKHKSEKNDDDLNHRSKRSKSGDDSRDREIERGSSRHRSSPRDGERSDRDRPRSSREHRDRDKERDREERNGKDRHRDRDRDKERVRDRDRERESDRDRNRRERDHHDNEKEIDREREQSRRSRSHSERRREEPDRERSRDREYKEREMEREREHRERDRESRYARAFFGWSFWQLSQAQELRRHKEKKEEVAEPEADPERDQRTVFAYQISLKADERDVYDFFSRAGKVRDVRLIMDRNSRRSKGVGGWYDTLGDISPCCLKGTAPFRSYGLAERNLLSKGGPEPSCHRAGLSEEGCSGMQVNLPMLGLSSDTLLGHWWTNSPVTKLGYIEFFDAMSVPMAIALSGQPLLGQPVMVKPSEAEKNLVQSTTSAAAVAAAAGGLIGPYSGGVRRLYVGNLHLNMKEDQLRQVFEPFGTVELVQLPSDPETGNCKGFGFVQFARLEDARAAQSLNGQLEIAGRVIKVSAVTDQPGMQDVGTNAGDFDDDEGGGLALNARSRALLMQKLDRSGFAPSVAGPLGNPVVNSPGLALPTPILGASPSVSPLVSPLVQASVPALAGLPGAGLTVPPVAVPSVDILGVPSECLLLKNMFDPKLETEPDFDLDIKEDVQDECSKFGSLKHIYVEKNSDGFVYLRFENTQAAISAQRALHGRWFAGKMITATFMIFIMHCGQLGCRRPQLFKRGVSIVHSVMKFFYLLSGEYEDGDGHDCGDLVLWVASFGRM